MVMVNWGVTDGALLFKISNAVVGENQELVTDEPVEVQDCRKITDHSRGIYRVYPKLIKENRRMSTCNRLDLQTLGSQLVMLKNLPDHYSNVGGSKADV
jgi:hypothetical protein